MVPLIVAVGNGFTVTTALPVCACTQAEARASRMLTREYVTVPAAAVGTGTVTLFPEVVVTV